MASAWKEEMIGVIPDRISQANSFALIGDRPLYQVADSTGERNGIYIASDCVVPGAILLGPGMYTQGQPLERKWIRDEDRDDLHVRSLGAGIVDSAPQGGGTLVTWGDKKFGPFGNVYGYSVYRDKPLFSISGHPMRDVLVQPGEGGSFTVQWGEDTLGFYHSVSFGVPAGDRIAFVAKRILSVEDHPGPGGWGGWVDVKEKNFIVRGDEQIVGDVHGEYTQVWSLGYEEGGLVFHACDAEKNFFVVCGNARYPVASKDINSIRDIRSFDGVPLFVEPRGGEQALRYGNEELARHTHIHQPCMRNGVVAYIAADGRGMQVLAGGRASRTFVACWNLYLVGTLPIYGGRKTDRWGPVTIMAGDEEGPTYDDIFSLTVENNLLRLGAVRDHEILLVTRQF